MSLLTKQIFPFFLKYFDRLLYSLIWHDTSYRLIESGSGYQSVLVKVTGSLLSGLFWPILVWTTIFGVGRSLLALNEISKLANSVILAVKIDWKFDKRFKV